MTWAKKLTRWWPHRCAGERYDLTHLHPFRFTLPLPALGEHSARSIDVRIGFSAHTFTRSCKEGDRLEQHYVTRRETRTFCPDRYALSRLLPGLVRDFGGRNCFFADRENYFVVELPEQLPRGQEYWVFFDVRPAGEADAVLVFVQSAYPSDGAPQPRGKKRKKVGFNVLVNHALRGTRPSPPP